MENAEIFDRDMFESFIGDDKEAAREMGELFLTRAREYYEELAAACTKNDSEEWKEVAHKMKGMAGFSGTVRLQLLCKTAQDNYEISQECKKSLLTAIEFELGEAQAEIKHYLTTLN